MRRHADDGDHHVGAAGEDTKSANHWLPRCQSYLNGNSLAITGDAHFCAGLIEGMGYVAASGGRLCIANESMRGVLNELRRGRNECTSRLRRVLPVQSGP